MTALTVWLASYPKSGNTWLRAIYTALRWKVAPDINALGGGPAAARKAFDAALGARSSDLTQEEVEALRPKADEVILAGLIEDYWRKIHDGLFPGPFGESVISPRTTRCALYVVRDPRDVAVSWAHHADVSMAKAVEQLCSSKAVLGSTNALDPQLPQRLGTWSEHVRSWTESPPFPVHVLRYEDCLAHPVATFTAAFTSAGLPATEAEMAEAVAWCSLERLQAQEIAVGFAERQSRSGLFFRRASPRGWKDELPAEFAGRIEHEHGALMTRYGYLPA